jgi:folate-dependent tRNA-U54 methylase TrmFO/GidA
MKYIRYGVMKRSCLINSSHVYIRMLMIRLQQNLRLGSALENVRGVKKSLFKINHTKIIIIDLSKIYINHVQKAHELQ